MRTTRRASRASWLQWRTWMKRLLSTFPPYDRLVPFAVAFALSLALVGLFAWQPAARGDERAVVVPAPAVDDSANTAAVAKAVLAGGCFWGMQGVFEHVKGVTGVVSGYT